VRFESTPLQGAIIVYREPVHDARGAFARMFCVREFAEHQLDTSIVQCNLSFNLKRGTLRGMHYQQEPHSEAKLVTCFSGALYDVIVDIRDGSPTQYSWFGIELRAGDNKSLYIPKGFAHGFQTLEPETLVHYQMSDFFSASAATGLRFDDPRLAITWPLVPESVAAKDLAFALLPSKRVGETE
jgi:dTDP-4-dehydrorhamnose 3,5-epimerase